MKALRILIADDDDGFAVALQALLETEPLLEIVGRAVNGSDAVRLAMRLKPHVVLMDVDMPVLDGVEATRIIQSYDDEIDVILITGYQVAERLADAQMETVGYVHKDDAFAELIPLLLETARADES